MNVTIRPVKVEDAPAIAEIRRMDGVREQTMGLISNRIDRTENFLKGLTADDHTLIAEVEDGIEKKVVGMVGMTINKSPRARHSASFGLWVRTDYQGKGIGRKLFEKVIDLADNWLMLVRLELEVFTDNERAIKLYKSFGFEIEGTKKYAIIRNGKYDDCFVMARYNKSVIK